MKKKSKRRLYETPRAIVLSASLANGQTVTPYGMCTFGSSPSTYTCNPGSNPAQDPGACSPTGNYPQVGNCISGGNVINLCSVGSFVTS